MAKLDLPAVTAAFGADPAIEREGAWCDLAVFLGEQATGWRICLRSQHASRVRDAAIKQHRKYLALYQAKKVPPVDQTDADFVELLATQIVVAWEGFRLRDGSELPCTPENIRAVFTDYPELLDYVKSWSDERANYRATVVEAVVKTVAPN